MKLVNPFLFITPRDKEKIIGKKDFLKDLKTTVKKSLKTKKSEIILLQGDVGSGKTLFIKKLVKEFDKSKIKKMSFNMNTLNDLRKIFTKKDKKKMVIIDKMDIINHLPKELQKKIINLIIEFTELGINFLIAVDKKTKSLIKDLNNKFKKYLIVKKIPKLEYADAEDLVISRLNEERTKKSESIEPFTQEELKKLFEKSKGNPRMLLMLCASLYEQKLSD